MNDVYTFLPTYYKDDLMVDDVIDCALLGICSNVHTTHRKSIVSEGNNAAESWKYEAHVRISQTWELCC